MVRAHTQNDGSNFATHSFSSTIDDVTWQHMNKSRRITDSKTSFFIFPESPFDFERSAGIHGRFEKSLPDVYENGVYKRVLHLAGNLVLVLVTSTGTIEKPRLSVEVHPHLLAREVKALRRRYREASIMKL